MTDHSGAYDYNLDPKHLGFMLARYSFVAKLLSGKGRVLEVACGDGFKSRVVRQAVCHLTAFDGDAELIDKAKEDSAQQWPIEFSCADALSGRYGEFDAVYCLDFFEHIRDERELLSRLVDCAPVCIIGTPSKESQPYASEGSRRHHVNCKSGEDLRTLCQQYWRQVFMFGMNDSTIHGDLTMARYLFALCVR